MVEDQCGRIDINISDDDGDDDDHHYLRMLRVMGCTLVSTYR